MDPLQLAGIVAISAGVGFLAAQHKYGRQIKNVQMAVFNRNVESITRMTKAAIETLTQDYQHPEAEATDKFFARCRQVGMALTRIDTETGKVESVNSEAPKS